MKEEDVLEQLILLRNKLYTEYRLPKIKANKDGELVDLFWEWTDSRAKEIYEGLDEVISILKRT